MKVKVDLLKYFSALFIFAIALNAGWWMWNYYMQSSRTRDGKAHAELVEYHPGSLRTDGFSGGE